MTTPPPLSAADVAEHPLSVEWRSTFRNRDQRVYPGAKKDLVDRMATALDRLARVEGAVRGWEQNRVARLRNHQRVADRAITREEWRAESLRLNDEADRIEAQMLAALSAAAPGEEGITVSQARERR